mgnify:CR=1 FL=1
MSNDTSTPQVHRLMPWSNIDTGEQEIAFSVQKKIDGTWRNCLVGGRALFDSKSEAIAALEAK